MSQQDQPRRAYPMIPARIWWQLRAKSKRSPPAEISASYVATACGISEKAAQNIIPHLRRVGLIEKDSVKSTQRLFDWREDETYPKVCAQIASEIYPQELRDALPAPNPDRTQAERWFARTTQTGESASKQMAAFYALIAKADPGDADIGENGETSGVRARASRPVPAQPARAQRALTKANEVAPNAPNELAGPMHHEGGTVKSRHPSMHIDIQIHISPQASPEQIDAIFSSMGRHLYGNKS